jgi:DNA-binding transcriptional LysR family regulator
VRHNCVRFRFAGTGAIYSGSSRSATGSSTTRSAATSPSATRPSASEAALEGIGLAYTFEPLVRQHLKDKRLKRVLATFSPTFPGFYLYYPSRRNQSTKLRALVDYAKRHQ